MSKYVDLDSGFFLIFLLFWCKYEIELLLYAAGTPCTGSLREEVLRILYFRVGRQFIICSLFYDPRMWPKQQGQYVGEHRFNFQNDETRYRWSKRCGMQDWDNFFHDGILRSLDSGCVWMVRFKLNSLRKYMMWILLNYKDFNHSVSARADTWSCNLWTYASGIVPPIVDRIDYSRKAIANR